MAITIKLKTVTSVVGLPAMPAGTRYILNVDGKFITGIVLSNANAVSEVTSNTAPMSDTDYGATATIEEAPNLPPRRPYPKRVVPTKRLVKRVLGETRMDILAIIGMLKEEYLTEHPDEAEPYIDQDEVLVILDDMCGTYDAKRHETHPTTWTLYVSKKRTKSESAPDETESENANVDVRETVPEQTDVHESLTQLTKEEHIRQISESGSVVQFVRAEPRMTPVRRRLLPPPPPAPIVHAPVVPVLAKQKPEQIRKKMTYAQPMAQMILIVMSEATDWLSSRGVWNALLLRFRDVPNKDSSRATVYSALNKLKQAGRIVARFDPERGGLAYRPLFTDEIANYGTT